MVWRIGIDEAGYGPNLGPLVMSAVAWRVPDEAGDLDLWSLLPRLVRRPGGPADRIVDARLVVGDSKLVYKPGTGLAPLERTVLALLGGAGPSTFLDFLDRLGPDTLVELRNERWFAGTTPLPDGLDPEDLAACAGLVRTHVGEDLPWAACRVVCPPRFNALTRKWNSKAAVLGLGFAEMMAAFLKEQDAGEIEIVADKHGGRNQYAALLQHAFPDGMVLAREEGADRSVYEVVGYPRRIRATFRPRADDGDLCVALASMLAKYVRELCMAEFNVFWAGLVPDLKPTAGYPTDARRFYAAILPALSRAGLEEDAVWRVR